MKRRWLLALATLGITLSGSVVAWVVLRSDSDTTRISPGSAQDWPDNCGGLVSEISYNVDPDNGRFESAQDAAKEALKHEVRDDKYDKVEKRDSKTRERSEEQSGPGEYVAKKNTKLIAIVTVDKMANGKYAAGGLSVCARDQKQYAPSSSP